MLTWSLLKGAYHGAVGGRFLTMPALGGAAGLAYGSTQSNRPEDWLSYGATGAAMGLGAAMAPGALVKKSMEDAVRGHLEVFSLKTHAGVGYVQSDPDSRLIKAMRWALEKEGVNYKLIEGFGGSDSRYFSNQGADLFDFGPEGDNLHGANEWVSLSSIRQNAEVFHTLLEVLSRDKSPV